MSDTWSSIQAHKKQLDSLRERLQRRRKQDSGHLGEARGCWGRCLAREGLREPWRKKLPSWCLSSNVCFFNASYIGSGSLPPQQHRCFIFLQVVAASSHPGLWFLQFSFPGRKPPSHLRVPPSRWLTFLKSTRASRLLGLSAPIPWSSKSLFMVNSHSALFFPWL